MGPSEVIDFTSLDGRVTMEYGRSQVTHGRATMLLQITEVTRLHSCFYSVTAVGALLFGQLEFLLDGVAGYI